METEDAEIPPDAHSVAARLDFLQAVLPSSANQLLEVAIRSLMLRSLIGITYRSPRWQCAERRAMLGDQPLKSAAIESLDTELTVLYMSRYALEASEAAVVRGITPEQLNS